MTTSPTHRVVTTPAELYALAPGTVILEDLPDTEPHERKPLRRRTTGDWIGEFLVTTPEKLTAADGWRALVLHEGADTRAPHEVAESLAPAAMAALRTYFDTEWPGLPVTIRRSRKKARYDERMETYVNVQWDDAGLPGGVERSRREQAIEKAAREVAASVGLAGAWVNFRRKTRPPLVTVPAIRKIVNEAGYRTIADSYARARGAAFVQITQSGDEVRVRFNLRPDLEVSSYNTLRAEEMATEIAEKGYTINWKSPEDRSLFYVTRPATDPQ